MNASEIRLKIKESYADERDEVECASSEIRVKYDCKREILRAQLREIQQKCKHTNVKSEWVEGEYYDDVLEHTCLDCLENKRWNQKWRNEK